MVTDAFAPDLARNAANHVPLSPVSFLTRAAGIWPDRIAVRHGPFEYSYRSFEERCRRLASALAQRGIGRGDTVAVMAPNIPAMLEAHYAVPALGAVLNPLNVRLDAQTIAFCLKHGRAKLLLTDAEFAPTVRAALAMLQQDIVIVDIADSEGPAGERLERSPTTSCSPGAIRALRGRVRRTNGIRCRCSTPPGPRVTPKAWSITIVAPT